jgi:hypothetical protein
MLRRPLRILSVFSLFALALCATSRDASAAVAGVDRDILAGSNSFPGDADFGSGTHLSGTPTGPFTVTWDYTPINGVVAVTATVNGTLYMDSLFGGCARLKVQFQDINRNIISTPQPIQFCGPGGDANNSANQRPNLTIPSPSDSRVRLVQLIVGFGTTSTNIVDDRTTTEFFPGVTPTDKIDSGTADLGGAGPFPIHLFGSPVDPYSASVLLQDSGVVKGDVKGILFWDSTSAGTACAIVDFRNASGTILSTRTIKVTGPSGGNALQSTNQASFDASFSNAAVFSIRLRVGTGTGTTAATASCATLSGVTAKIFSLGPAVGFGEGVPFAASAQVRTETIYGVQWTVPDPENWHSLSTLDIRLINDAGEILRVRWDEATNTFSEFNPQTERFGRPVQPGSGVRFQGSDVSLLLDDTQVIGSGPSGPSVLLNLALEFKAGAGGSTFAVEVKAADDQGGVQGWDEVGGISVQ